MNGLRSALLVLLALVAAAGVALGLPGDLDQSFDGDGRRIIDLSAASDAAQDLAVQPDGRIVVAGYYADPRVFFVGRLLPGGAFDTSFAGDGATSADFPGAADAAWDVALQPDGKIVLVGETTTGLPDVAVARFTAEGAPDPAFDGDGQTSFDISGSDVFEAVALQPDGKIVLGGSFAPGGARGFGVVRLTPSGSFDPAFGGVRRIEFGPNDYAWDLAVQPDGKILIAGFTESGGVYQAAIARLTPSGEPDPGFGIGGERVFAALEEVQAIALQPDGRIVLAGYAGPAPSDMAVARLNPDGSPDPSFASGGVARVDFGSFDSAYGAVLQPNGKIVVAGSARVGGSDRIALARLQPGGALDTTFAGDGKEIIEFGGSGTAFGAALQRDGGILAAGDAGPDIAIARVEGDRPPADAGPAAGGAGAVPRCAGRPATIVGTAGRDALRGTPKADVIVALAGRDVVRAGGGGDIVCGGRGDDRLTGGAGKDRLDGGPGDDRVLGQAGADRLLGRSGRDLLVGGAGADRLLGAAGRDRCLGGAGRDRTACEKSLS
jgi:uncharacterized delta-60 repeat protein